MTKVLCQQEKCDHNKDWICSLEKLHMKVVFNEPTPFDGWDTVECRDFRKLGNKEVDVE